MLEKLRGSEHRHGDVTMHVRVTSRCVGLSNEKEAPGGNINARLLLGDGLFRLSRFYIYICIACTYCYG